jgi:hypothetical protein
MCIKIFLCFSVGGTLFDPQLDQFISNNMDRILASPAVSYVTGETGLAANGGAGHASRSPKTSGIKVSPTDFHTVNEQQLRTNTKERNGNLIANSNRKMAVFTIAD